MMAAFEPFSERRCPVAGDSSQMTRRAFCASTILAAVAARAATALGAEKAAPAPPPSYAPAAGFPPCRAVTKGPKYHFFGYYDKCPWDASGRTMLGMEVGFMDRQPKPDDRLTIGRIDLQNDNRFEPLDETVAWCWQQGTMLRWMPPAEDAAITYNMREGDTFYSVIRNLKTGEVRRLPRPIYSLSPSGDFAVMHNFARVARTRPGYGYEGVKDPTEGVLQPTDDGIYRMDIKTGESRLIISLDTLAKLKPKDDMKGAEHWVNHLEINPAGNRFFFLHRWKVPGAKSWHTRALTANPDGSGLFILADDDYFSHFAWFSATEIVAHATRGPLVKQYIKFTDQADKAEGFGTEVFTGDGHCSFWKDRQWMLTDTYPDKQRNRTLILYHMASGKRVDIGKFFAPKEIDGPTRCDLHPRWSRDGRQVCIDSAHEGARQIYVIDVGGIVGA